MMSGMKAIGATDEEIAEELEKLRKDRQTVLTDPTDGGEFLYSETYSHSMSGRQGAKYSVDALIPYYYTYHWSDEYDIGPVNGIPSGKNVNNGYGADERSYSYNLRFIKHFMSVGIYILK